MLDVGLSCFVCLFFVLVCVCVCVCVLLQVLEFLLLKFPIHQNQNKTYPGVEHELTTRDLWGIVEMIGRQMWKVKFYKVR